MTFMWAERAWFTDQVRCLWVLKACLQTRELSPWSAYLLNIHTSYIATYGYNIFKLNFSTPTPDMFLTEFRTNSKTVPCRRYCAFLMHAPNLIHVSSIRQKSEVLEPMQSGTDRMYYSLEHDRCLNKLSGSRQSQIKRNESLCCQFFSFLDTEIIMLCNIYTKRRDRNYSLIENSPPFTHTHPPRPHTPNLRHWQTTYIYFNA